MRGGRFRRIARVLRRGRPLPSRPGPAPAAWRAPATLAILTLAWAAAALGANGHGARLEQLMALLAQRKHGEVRYVEKDYLGILERPLKSSGVLIYDAPDRLEKKTLQPRKESLVLEHGKLTVRRGDRTYHLDLREYPQVAPYVDAIRATMAGDLDALEKVFTVRFGGRLGHWQLRLVPLDPKVARQLRGIRIAGARQNVESVQIDKANGDRSVMTMGAPESAAPP